MGKAAARQDADLLRFVAYEDVLDLNSALATGNSAVRVPVGGREAAGPAVDLGQRDAMADLRVRHPRQGWPSGTRRLTLTLRIPL